MARTSCASAWRHPAALQDRPARPWLFAVARNLAVDAHRARQARPNEVGQSAFDTLPPTSANSYAALKAAVLEHASGLGHALAPKGIRVNTVSHGPIDFPGGAWDKLHEARPEFYEGIRARIPLGRLGRAEEIERAVAFLASPAASFCNAVNLVVDGGFVSRVQF